MPWNQSIAEARSVSRLCDRVLRDRVTRRA